MPIRRVRSRQIMCPGCMYSSLGKSSYSKDLGLFCGRLPKFGQNTKCRHGSHPRCKCAVSEKLGRIAGSKVDIALDRRAGDNGVIILSLPASVANELTVVQVAMHDCVKYIIGGRGRGRGSGGSRPFIIALPLSFLPSFLCAFALSMDRCCCNTAMHRRCTS